MKKKSAESTYNGEEMEEGGGIPLQDVGTCNRYSL